MNFTLLVFIFNTPFYIVKDYPIFVYLSIYFLFIKIIIS